MRAHLEKDKKSNPLRLTVLAAMSEDYTTAPQHLQIVCTTPSNYSAPVKISFDKVTYLFVQDITKMLVGACMGTIIHQIIHPGP